ncbi:MAG: NYN domain-containing protein [Psychrosphaera sp.]|nr:NYN domain-containing protein [Psychrosphaera sp.]
MPQNPQKVVIFIDTDNAPAKHINKIIDKANSQGQLCIKRAYGNWKSPNIKPWEDVLQKFAIQPMQQYSMTGAKNATDMAMIIDAMDVLYTKDIDVFCIVSSDCDFTPLAMRLIADGKTVVGIGEKKAADAFVNACSEFVVLDEDVEVEDKNEAVTTKAPPALTIVPKKLKSRNDINQNPQKVNLIRDVVFENQQNDGWAFLGRVAGLVASTKTIDSNQFGHKKMGELIKTINLLEVKKAKDGHAWVRDMKRGNHLKTC